MNAASELLFWIFAVVTCGCAVAVVVSQNIVRMAFWLVLSLGSTAALFFLLNADFVAATQLLIYVGGTVVLLIFGVMLTASGPILKIATSPGEIFLGAGVGALLLAFILSTVVAIDWTETQTFALRKRGHNPAEVGNTVRPLGMAFLGLRPDRDLGQPADQELSTGYLLPFEVISVHLLVVLIGAAYLARAKRRLTSNADERW